jgi:hypothetical protein
MQYTLDKHELIQYNVELYQCVCEQASEQLKCILLKSMASSYEALAVISFVHNSRSIIMAWQSEWFCCIQQTFVNVIRKD